MENLKIVIHVDQRTGWPAVIADLVHLTRDYPESEIRVVADGDAVDAFRGHTDVVAALARAAKAKVQVQVCAISLLEQGLDPTKLPSYVDLVPMGVVALAKAQHEGFAYVKP